MSTANLSARARIRIRKPPEAVFDAFASAEQMSRFWFGRDADFEAGQPATFSMGSGETAFSFEVMVTECRSPERIAIEWEGQDGRTTQVTWTIEATGDGDSILTIEETGFGGEIDQVVRSALNSTGGFNQVIVAAKAWIEHGVALNVVADHA